MFCALNKASRLIRNTPKLFIKLKAYVYWCDRLGYWEILNISVEMIKLLTNEYNL